MWLQIIEQCYKFYCIYRHDEFKMICGNNSIVHNNMAVIWNIEHGMCKCNLWNWSCKWSDFKFYGMNDSCKGICEGRNMIK